MLVSSNNSALTKSTMTLMKMIDDALVGVGVVDWLVMATNQETCWCHPAVLSGVMRINVKNNCQRNHFDHSVISPSKWRQRATLQTKRMPSEEVTLNQGDGVVRYDAGARHSVRLNGRWMNGEMGLDSNWPELYRTLWYLYKCTDVAVESVRVCIGVGVALADSVRIDSHSLIAHVAAAGEPSDRMKGKQPYRKMLVHRCYDRSNPIGREQSYFERRSVIEFHVRNGEERDAVRY